MEYILEFLPFVDFGDLLVIILGYLAYRRLEKANAELRKDMKAANDDLRDDMKAANTAQSEALRRVEDKSEQGFRHLNSRIDGLYVNKAATQQPAGEGMALGRSPMSLTEKGSETSQRLNLPQIINRIYPEIKDKFVPDKYDSAYDIEQRVCSYFMWELEKHLTPAENKLLKDEAFIKSYRALDLYYIMGLICRDKILAEYNILIEAAASPQGQGEIAAAQAVAFSAAESVASAEVAKPPVQSVSATVLPAAAPSSNAAAAKPPAQSSAATALPADEAVAGAEVAKPPVQSVSATVLPAAESVASSARVKPQAPAEQTTQTPATSS